MFPILLGQHLGVSLLSHMGRVWLALSDTAKEFSKVAVWTKQVHVHSGCSTSSAALGMVSVSTPVAHGGKGVCMRWDDWQTFPPPCELFRTEATALPWLTGWPKVTSSREDTGLEAASYLHWLFTVRYRSNSPFFSFPTSRYRPCPWLVKQN